MCLSVAVVAALLQAPLQFTAQSFRLSDGREIAAERATLTVPERRSNPASRRIELALLRLPAVGAAKGPPIVFLPGSPEGSSGLETAAAAQFYPFFDALRSAGDVIVLDYRGSGESRPRLRCSPQPWTPGWFSDREAAMRVTTGLARQCAEELRRGGADLAGYNWGEVAEDVEALRHALGVPRISIVGFSSGTHAALAYLRRYDRAVARVVMFGTEGPDHTRKLPSNVDRQLRAIAELVARDTSLNGAITDFPALVRGVIDSLDRTPAIVELQLPGTKEKVREPVSGMAVAYFTTKNLSTPEEFAMVPALFHSLAQGDVSLLTRLVQRVALRGPMNPLAYLFDGAAGISPARQARIDREARIAMLGNVVNFPFPEVTEAWGLTPLSARDREPVRSSTPALFVTGMLDGNTPPSQADEVRAGFSRSQHLLVRGGGHLTFLTEPSVWPRVVDFLAGRRMSDEPLTAAPVRFLPLRRR